MKYLFFSLLFVLLPSSFAFAHQPILIDGQRQIVVNEPEISKAYYGEFKGTSTTFLIRETNSFPLYVSILIPATSNASKKDITVDIQHENGELSVLSATSTTWTRMYEPYGGDDYFQGPEFRIASTSGAYTITVSREGGRGQYVLAIGEKESFTYDEIIQMIQVMPRIKSEVFDKPAWSAYFNRIGIYMGIGIVTLLIFYLLLGEVYRALVNFLNRLFGKAKNVHDDH